MPLAVWCQTWVESERGWGQRPDGCSLHSSLDACKQYCKEYWAKQPDDSVPSIYSKERGSPKLIEVSEKVYKIVEEETNIRLWQHEIHQGLEAALT